MLANETIKKPNETNISETIKEPKPVTLTEEERVFLQDLRMEQDEGPR